MRAVLLGSGGWIPTRARETCCLLVRNERDALLVDAGTGVGRLVEQPELLADVDVVHVLLTHFHLDHVVGLSYLPALDLPAPPAVYGPGRELYDRPTEELLARLLGQPFFSSRLTSIVGAVNEIGAGAVECGSFSLRARRQDRHSEPTLAFRIDERITYCTDTAYDEDNARFAEGSSLLFHEAWHVGRHPDEKIHTSAEHAGRIASDASAGTLALIHVNPLLEAEDSLLSAARGEFAAAVLGTDLLAFDVR